MLRNNNKAVVARMAKNSLKSNKRRSITMILAVLLSSFMLFSVFTVGVTYFKMLRIQNIRLNGAEFDAIMYGITDEQMEMCKADPDIQKLGLCSVSGYVEETPYDSTPNVSLMYADKVFWNEMMVPARESVIGKYPEKEDEVMVTEYALEKCGFEEMGIGDSFTVVYGVKDEKFEKTFCISGIWDGYGDKSSFYVSEEFYNKTELKPSDVSSGRYHIEFKKDLMSQEEQNTFIEKMNLGKSQRLFFTVDLGYSVQIFTGIAGLVFVICLCAYLLIYNIMYLSVVGNIRYYGLLQTIGMTGRQIYYFMRWQMLLIGGIGIAGGIVLGSGVSFLLIPSVVKSLGIRTGQAGEISISFHPAIFLLTIFLTGFTVFIASRKPATIAVVSSPLAALGYRSAANVKKSRKTRRGYLIWRMAKEQITKDKKKSTVVMLSLAAGMAVFLCVTTLIDSQDSREFSYNYRNLDMVLTNDTMTKEKKEERIQIFDQGMIQKLDSVKGVTGVDSVIYAEITVPWEPEFSDKWMREFYETWMEIPYEDDIEEYKQYPENFGSSLVGITDADFRELNETLEEPIDESSFLSGKTCLLYQDHLSFDNSDVVGEIVTCAQYEDQDNTRSYEIAGLVDINDYTVLLGYPPTIIVSDKVVKGFVDDPIIAKVGIRYEEEYNEEVETALLSVMNDSSYAKDYSYSSKIELMKNVKKAQGNMMEVGIGIVLILALIGIMNYINTSVGSIQSRQVEISIMESVGMTGKQVKQMLVVEGMIYAGGAWLITMTAGLGVTYYLYQSLNYYGAVFEIPILPVLAAVALTIFVCISVPIIAYRQLERRSAIVERIKGAD
ncbi:MAG: FtsX-like permease family protein [Lachnospiraceae bacterium]